jgi:hypothetical protein
MRNKEYNAAELHLFSRRLLLGGKNFDAALAPQDPAPILLYYVYSKSVF